jgi:hypothetical protein
MRRFALALFAISTLVVPASAADLSAGDAAVAALDELCGKSQVEATSERSIMRMEEAHGWSFEGATYSAEGSGGAFSVRITPDGCVIAAKASGDDMRMADRAIIAWTTAKGLAMTQPDNHSANGVSTLRRRGDPASGKITWSVLVWPGDPRPAELDVAYARPR